jgi:uncharacterized protein
MTAHHNTRLILDVFCAIELRDGKRFAELLDPDFEIVWPDSLPYGGTARGVQPSGQTWGQTWEPLQPTPAEKKMDARVVSASSEEVVVLWKQRGLSPTGERFEGEVLGLYRLKEGKLARAQMFYFDTVPLLRFLQNARAAR